MSIPASQRKSDDCSLNSASVSQASSSLYSFAASMNRSAKRISSSSLPAGAIKVTENGSSFPFGFTHVPNGTAIAQRSTWLTNWAYLPLALLRVRGSASYSATVQCCGADGTTRTSILRLKAREVRRL